MESVACVMIHLQYQEAELSFSRGSSKPQVLFCHHFTVVTSKGVRNLGGGSHYIWCWL